MLLLYYLNFLCTLNHKTKQKVLLASGTFYSCTILQGIEQGLPVVEN